MNYAILVHTANNLNSVIYNFKVKERGKSVLDDIIKKSKLDDDTKALALRSLDEMLDLNCPGSYLNYEGHFVMAFLLTDDNVTQTHGRNKN
jgi:hypothetical protein